VKVRRTDAALMVDYSRKARVSRFHEQSAAAFIEGTREAEMRNFGKNSGSYSAKASSKTRRGALFAMQ